ncbi:hypothetical protein BDQ17DRAFT_337658 [Cyathus striatus]|nr:hypothetical protein BDQ17DRAFT_337658 [Cyathus striatus]
MEGAPPPTKKRAGSKSAARSVPQSEDDAHTHGRKPSSSRAKSKALESEAEVEENLIPRKPSRLRSKATTSESESDMDVIPRKASRNAKPRPTVVIEEDESQEEPPKKKPLTKTRSKAKVIDSEIEIEHSNPVTVTNGKPPSKPSSRSKAKLAPVPVEDEPERSESAVEDEVTDIEPAPLRRKSSTSAPPRPIVPEEENEYHDVTMHDLQDIQQVPSTPPRPTASLHSDRDINLVPSSTVANVAISQPSSTGCSSSAAIPEEPAMVKEKLPIRAPPTPLQAEEDKEDRDVADVIMHEDQDTQLIPSTPPRPATPIRHDYAINPFSSSGPNTVLVQSSTANQSSATAEPMEQPVIPPLSKLPFTTLHALTDAEMDMTVEEWIRYQMDVERRTRSGRS